MNHMHDIDNDDFLFDSFEPLEPPSLLEESAREPKTPSILVVEGRSNPTPPLYAQDRSPPDSSTTTMSIVDAKGKGVSHPSSSEPMSIPLSGNVRPEVDLFADAFESAGSSSTRRFDSSPAFDLQASQVGIILDGDGVVEIPSDEQANPTAVGKGKARELPPTLPPLHFSPTEFSYSSSEWPSVAGPSSYGSGYTSLGDAEGSPSTPSPLTQISNSASLPNTPDIAGSSAPVMFRRRTTSTVSKQSRRSISAPSLPKVKVKFAAGSKAASGTLARKLLFKKSPPTSPRSASADFSSSSTGGATFTPDLSDLGYVGQGSCLIPWSREIRSRSPLATPVVETNSVWGVVDSQPIRVSRLVDPLPLRAKGRSYSSPLPVPASIFDIVPLAPTDLFEPLPPVLPDYFDEYLPHELKLHVLSALLDLHAAEHEKRVQSGKWTALKAGSHKNKWVGTDKGVRELFKLSRVRSLSCYGLVWSLIYLCAGLEILAATCL